MSNILGLLGSLLKLEKFAGVRTYVAALGLFGLGLYQFSQSQPEQATASILAALALVGLRDQKPTPSA